MKNMKMRTKLILGFSLPVLLTILTVVVSMFITTECVDIVAEMNEAGAEELHQHFLEHEEITDAVSAELMEVVNSGKDSRVERMRSIMQISNWISFGILAVSVIITVLVGLALIKAIMRSVRQLSAAAKEIALGRVNNIEMTKYNNDEFGDLVDEYTKVIDNIKQQAEVAEEVSNGNLTISVTPASSTTSWRIPATIVSLSSSRSARMIATFNGWMIYGSPDLRSWFLCASSATLYAFSISDMSSLGWYFCTR